MQESDLPTVLALEASVYEFPWSIGVFRDCLAANYDCRVLPAEQGLSAYLVVAPGYREHHLLNIAVSPAEQGMGLGRRLLEFLLADLPWGDSERLLLEVRASNVRARKIYRNAGFRQIGERKDYYRCSEGRESAILMAWTP